MSITIKEALKLGRLNECEVVSGFDGLDRKVSSVTILEDPNVLKWVKKDELLLTSLYSLRDDREETLVELLYRLNSIGTAGLAIKPSNYLGEIPESIIVEAERLSLPIIFIPENIYYLDILNPVLHRIFTDKVVLQEDVNLATSSLEEMLINGDSIDKFINNLENIVQHLVSVDSDFLNFEINNEHDKLSSKEIIELENLKTPILMSRSKSGFSYQSLVSPILVDGKYTGNITIWDIDKTMLAFDYAVLEKASNLLSLEVLKVIIEQDIKMKHEDDFLREILFSSDVKKSNLQDFSDVFNINSEDQFYCLVFKMNHVNDRNDVYNTHDNKIYSYLKKEDHNVLVAKIKNRFCIIRSVKSDKNKVREYCEKLTQQFSGRINSFGIGEMKNGLSGMKKSYEQANYALNFIDTKKELDNVIFYDELGAYILINMLNDRQELDDFYNKVFSKLLSNKQSEELLDTLNQYFLWDGKLKETSEQLFIHINTLKYRIKKIEELTGNHLKTSEGNFNLHLALKIHKLFKNN